MKTIFLIAVLFLVGCQPERDEQLNYMHSLRVGSIFDYEYCKKLSGSYSDVIILEVNEERIIYRYEDQGISPRYWFIHTYTNKKIYSIVKRSRI